MINFELFVVEGRVHGKKSKIRNTNTSKITNRNTIKIKIDRLIWSRRFSILFLFLLLLCSFFPHYGLTNPLYQRRKSSPKNIQLTAPNAR